MAPTFNTLDDLTVSLVRASWQGSLAILVVWLLVRCARHLPPQVACWLWRLADLKLVVALVWAAPVLLPLLPPETLPDPVPVPAASSEPSPLPPPGLNASPLTPEIPAPMPEAAGPRPVSWLAVFWLCGVVGAALMTVRDAGTIRRLRRSCMPVHDRAITKSLDDLAEILGLRRLPEVRTGLSVTQPMLVGMFRPAILLPAGMMDASRSTANLHSVLAHELAHIRRRDLWWGALSGLVRALFFFHPLVWLAHREALIARETACDALALGASGLKPSDYGRILLEIAAGRPQSPARWSSTLGMAGSATSLKRRFIAMKSHQRLSRRQLLSWSFGVLLAGGAGIIPWQVVPQAALAQEPQDDIPSTEVAEARLKAAQAEQKVAADRLAQAEADAEHASKEQQFRRSELNRMHELVKKGAIEPEILKEEEPHLRTAQAAEQGANAKVADMRAACEAAQAAVREAEAIRDISRLGADRETDLRKGANACTRLAMTSHATRPRPPEPPFRRPRRTPRRPGAGRLPDKLFHPASAVRRKATHRAETGRRGETATGRGPKGPARSGGGRQARPRPPERRRGPFPGRRRGRGEHRSPLITQSETHSLTRLDRSNDGTFTSASHNRHPH